jgi:threonine synthase
VRRIAPQGVEVWLKLESDNPTGSFKDRGLSMAVNRARELGAPGIQLPSAGNAALAAAAYAAAASLPCRVAVPLDTPLAVRERCLLYGAEVLSGGANLVESAARLAEFNDGYWDLSTFREPYRVEGKKTMAFELAEQLDWELPDWIIYPTGGGTGIVAMHKAFGELRTLGLLGTSRTRFLVVQMAGCAPIVEAFERGADRAQAWSDPSTRVWGLRVPRSLADFLILEALRDSGGMAVRVEESEVSPMQRQCARSEGLWVGPEGAAALAGLMRLAALGQLRPGARVVVFQTGHPANYGHEILSLSP